MKTKNLKHIELFESFEATQLQDPTGSPKPEDVSSHGDKVFCWNFEDGWMVALVDESMKDQFEAFLSERESSMVQPTKFYPDFQPLTISPDPGIAFVTCGMPSRPGDYYSELKVIFRGPQFVRFPNWEGGYIFPLKKNTVIGYRWNGGNYRESINDYMANG